MKRKLFAFTILSAIVLLLGSCAVHQKYPQEWSGVLPSEEKKCPNVSGTYVNSGVMADEDRTPVSMDRLFFPDQMTVGTQVQVAQSDDDTLDFSVRDAQRLACKKQYSKKNKEYRCSPEGIIMPYRAYHAGEGFELVKESGSLSMAKSADGALVIHKESSSLGVVCLIPLMGSESRWYRFEKRAM